MKHVSIGDFVERVQTWNPQKEGGDSPFQYIDIGAVSQTEKAITEVQTVRAVEAPSRARQIVRAGDILVSTVRPNLNAVAVVPDDLDGATASTGFTILRPNERKLSGNFLFHWVRSPAFITEMIRQATGQSYPAVSDKIVKASRIPLLPLSEQKRIAEILDQADALRRLRSRALDKLNTLGQAIFHEMFGDGLPSNTTVRLGDVTSKIGSGATPRGGDSAYKSEGIPLIRSMNVRDGAFSNKGLAFIDDEQASKLDNVIVEANDVLLNITGASVARVCIAPRDMNGARVNQHVAIIRCDDSLLPEFLEAFLLLPSIKAKLLNIAEAGATRQAITKAQIQDFQVPKFDPSEQKAFVERRKLISNQRARMHTQEIAYEALFASLQHRAFKGEL